MPFKDLPKGQEPKLGMMLIMVDPNGRQMPARISEVGTDSVTLDLNHPLAGETLHFNVEIVEVRDATKEELEHGHVHGAGGHHH